MSPGFSAESYSDLNGLRENLEKSQPDNLSQPGFELEPARFTVRHANCYSTAKRKRKARINVSSLHIWNCFTRTLENIPRTTNTNEAYFNREDRSSLYHVLEQRSSAYCTLGLASLTRSLLQHQGASVAAGGYAISLSLLHNRAYFVALLALYSFQQVLTTTVLEEL
ncbi:hypothetical protein ANN_12915 [Periplaneta americana]|uniref:Uncharacterized protein n=1 Tax=Periplaneta americana TaxID=6978 RepID=A0ABQ8TJX7_PERAM|nr:hypothetical protein ANN_12915 [Periplaneta americana]